MKEENTKDMWDGSVINTSRILQTFHFIFVEKNIRNMARALPMQH